MMQKKSYHLLKNISLRLIIICDIGYSIDPQFEKIEAPHALIIKIIKRGNY